MLKLSSWLLKIEDQIGGLLLLASVSLIFIQIVLRATIGFGISGVYELATFCMLWSVLITVGLGISRNVHVRVDVLMRIVPARVALVMELLIGVSVGLIGLALVYTGWLLVDESLTFGDSTLGTIRIPMWIPQLIMPISGLLILIHSAIRLLGIWRGKIPVIDDSELIAST